MHGTVATTSRALACRSIQWYTHFFAENPARRSQTRFRRSIPNWSTARLHTTWRTARIGRPRRIVESSRELSVERGSWNGTDLFRGDGYLSVLVTERAKSWLEKHLGGYVEFEEFDSK